MTTPSMSWCGSRSSEQVVLERGGLALVPVDHEVRGRRLAQHRPLAPGREPGPTPPEQAHGVDLARDLLGRHAQRLAQALVPARGQVALEGVGVLVLEPRRHDAGGFADDHHAPPGGLRRRGLALGADGGVVDTQPALAPYPDECAVPGDLVVELPGAQARHQSVEGLRRDVTHETVVHRQARGPAAVGDALGLLEREHPVSRRRPRADPERALDVVEHLVGAAQHAGDVGAHRDHVGPHRRRCGASRRTRPSRGPRPASGPPRSAISSIASGRNQPSCSWAR